MPKTDRVRVDYMPCPAAMAALEAAQALYPDSSTQALVDRLVITGLSALVQGHWQPPRLWGKRERWKLPPNLSRASPEDGAKQRPDMQRVPGANP